MAARLSLAQSFKAGCFGLEALNSLATTYQFYYLYFFAEAKFGFDKGKILLLATGVGLSYAAASVLGGRMAQTRGYLNTLGLGCALMGAGQVVAAFSDGLVVHGLVTLVCVLGMGMTWPALQALASDGETGRPLQNMLGIYNFVWSFFGAVAYLTGGAMIESWGLHSIFFVPIALNLILLGLIAVLKRHPIHRGRARAAPLAVTAEGGNAAAEASRVDTRRFLRLAWFANPFAYLTINTVVASGPAIAKALSLSPRYAGYCCSVWMFVRTAAFVFLWWWPGWHYRFRWMVAAYLGMIATFILILLAPTVSGLVAAQVGFGLFIGLIYYSSLYYSMDAGESKGEHGGIHEAAIGLGSAAGPAIGAATLYLVPQLENGTAKAVGVLLTLGFCGLIWLRRR